MSVARLAALALIAIGLSAQPASAQTQPAPAPSQARPAAPADPFGEDVMLASKTIVFSKGSANWDSAFDTLVESFKKIQDALDKQGVKADRPGDDDLHRDRRHRLRVPGRHSGRRGAEGAAAGRPEVGKSPDGRALKFIHRGSYDAMDSTYEAITNHLDEKRLEAKDLFVEYYVTDPLTTQEDNLVIEVYVPVK